VAADGDIRLNGEGDGGVAGALHEAMKIGSCACGGSCGIAAVLDGGVWRVEERAVTPLRQKRNVAAS